MPITVQLGQGTSVTLPRVVACSGMALREGKEPIQFHLHLEDGSEVYLPASEEVLLKMQALLNALYPAEK